MTKAAQGKDVKTPFAQIPIVYHALKVVAIRRETQKDG